MAFLKNFRERRIVSCCFRCLFQVWRWVRPSRAAEECHEGIDGNLEGLAERTQEEPVSDERREDYAGYHHEDDADPSLHLVRERAETSQKGEQDDLGTEEQDG